MPTIRALVASIDLSDVLLVVGLAMLAYGLAMLASWLPFVVIGSLFLAVGSGIALPRRRG